MPEPLLDVAVKIINAAYPDNAADLIWGNPLGTISGFQKNNDSANQKWVFRRGEPSGVAIESVAAPGSYASAFVQAKGAPLSGSLENIGWLIIPGDVPTENTFKIGTLDRKYVWSLDDSANYFTILLQPIDAKLGSKALWWIPTVEN